MRSAVELPRGFRPSSDKPPATSERRKVRGRLRDRSEPLAQGGPLRRVGPPTTATGRLRITVRLNEAAAPGALGAAGLQIEAAPSETGLVQGTIDPVDLPRLAALPQVAWVAPLDLPIHRAGSIATEGDAGSGADAVRQQGLDGSGVIVGVVSDGMDGLAEAQASGDLGEVTIPTDRRCRRGSGDEGTALLEIVHDVAPGARLMFAGPASSIEMINAVRCLTAAGADVIVDDLGFPLEPFFEDGPVALAVRAAVSAGVSYHSAAGNEAEEHYEAEFRPSPSTRYHDFNANPAGPVDNLDDVVVAPGGLVQCVLQWSDRFNRSANDYDLYLLDDAMNVVAAGTDVQDGIGNDDPLEVVAAMNLTSVPQVAHVVIDLLAGEPRRLKLLCFGGDGNEYVTPAGSVFGHPALAEVVSVGAVDQAEPGRARVESFSSQGPARILFPAEVLRPKPDLVALDGVSISNAGGFPLCPPFCRFFGTSAAAPHTAGVAALMLQRAPDLSPAALLAALRHGATDIDSPGEDSRAGAGLLNAVASLALVSGGTTPTTTPVVTTTSTTVPNASCEEACPDDGDECTLERCDVGAGCRSTPIVRAEGVVCLVDRLLTARDCQPGEISARVAKLIGRKAQKIRAHALRSVGAPPAKYARHVARALALLRKLRRKVDVAIGAGRLTGECQSEVVTTLARTVSLAESTVF
jgi:subtilisin family serine protease